MPARKSSQTKRLAGTARPCREQGRETLAAVSEVPAPPEYLSESAAREWGRVAPEAVRVGLTTADVRALALLCETLASEAELRAVIATEGHTIEAGSGGRKAHPALAALAQARHQSHNLLSSFGLNPRGRQALPPSPKPGMGEDNPFNEF